MVMSRWVPYGIASTCLAGAVVIHAFQERPNFYSACVYLSQSSACALVLANMFFVATLVLGKGLQQLCFGHLRAIEVEHLYERSWYAVTESCLAMTIFREEFDSRFLLFFTALNFLKIFHWLAQDRVDVMEQTTEVPRSFHVRMVSCIVALFALDTYLVRVALEDIFSRGPNAMIMFAFEFTILASIMLAVAGRYVLNLIEARQTETWDDKSTYVFYLDLGTDFIKLVTYIAFFATVFTFYGLPLHIIRDLYVTLRSFTTKCRNFMRFRQATRDMDTRYPDATEADLAALGDPTCIVCRDDMLHASVPQEPGEPLRTAFDKPKKLPCNHILHFRCLRSWLERQQSCPLCRRPVLQANTTPAAPENGNPAAGNAQAHLAGPRPPLAAPPGLANRFANIPGQVPNPVHPAQNGTAAPAPGPAVQFPRGYGDHAVPLPAGFQLPAGWALLPVTTGENPAQTAAARHGTEGVPAPSASTFTAGQARAEAQTAASASAPSTAQTGQLATGFQAPPIIPLFSGTNPFAVLQNTTDLNAMTAAIPTLSDDQVVAMEGSLRRTIEERIRVLAQVQARVTEGLTMLTRLATVRLPTDVAPAAGAATSNPSATATADTAQQLDDRTTMFSERPIDHDDGEPTDLKSVRGRPGTSFGSSSESAVAADARLEARPTAQPRRSPRRRRASQDSDGSAESSSGGGERRSMRLASRQPE